MIRFTLTVNNIMKENTLKRVAKIKLMSLMSFTVTLTIKTYPNAGALIRNPERVYAAAFCVLICYVDGETLLNFEDVLLLKFVILCFQIHHIFVLVIFHAGILLQKILVILIKVYSGEKYYFFFQFNINQFFEIYYGIIVMLILTNFNIV